MEVIGPIQAYQEGGRGLDLEVQPQWARQSLNMSGKSHFAGQKICKKRQEHILIDISPALSVEA
jgi:hypothetical protein